MTMTALNDKIVLLINRMTVNGFMVFRNMVFSLFEITLSLTTMQDAICLNRIKSLHIQLHMFSKGVPKWPPRTHASPSGRFTFNLRPEKFSVSSKVQLHIFLGVCFQRA